MGRPRGRPTKFDAEKANKVCAALSEGLFLTDAAALVDVDVRTVARWIELGEGNEKLGIRPKEPFASFARDVAHARAQFVYLTVKDINKGEDGTRGKRWILEKLRPRQYGERIQVHVEQHMNEVLDKLQGALPSNVFEQVLAVLSGEAGADSPAADPG